MVSASDWGLKNRLLAARSPVRPFSRYSVSPVVKVAVKAKDGKDRCRRAGPAGQRRHQ